MTPSAAGNVSYQLTCSGATGTTPIVVTASVTVTTTTTPAPGSGGSSGGGSLGFGTLLGLLAMTLLRLAGNRERSRPESR